MIQAPFSIRLIVDAVIELHGVTLLSAHAAINGGSNSNSPLHGQKCSAVLFAFLPGECAMRQEAEQF